MARDIFQEPDVTVTYELHFTDHSGWLVQEVRRTPVGLILWGVSVPLSDFLLEQSTPEEYPAAADTPLEAAEQLEQAQHFKDAGVHPWNAAGVNRLAASTLSRDIENFLDGLGMVLQPSELDALTDYLEDRG